MGIKDKSSRPVMCDVVGHMWETERTRCAIHTFMKSDKYVCNVATGRYTHRFPIYAPYTYILFFLSIELRYATPRSFALAFLSGHVNHATNMAKGIYEFSLFFSASHHECTDYWSVLTARYRQGFCVSAGYTFMLVYNNLDG